MKFEIISETKAKNIILINLGLESIYLNINWEYNGSEWKIKVLNLTNKWKEI